jgi:Putative, 10TM heavy-metal exporter
MDLHGLTHSFVHSLVITVFVIMMMMLIESINVYSKGNLVNKVSKNKLLQILLGASLGMIPGCLGTFAFVSLYIHGALSFGALLAVMIASFGDEAFFLISQSPQTAFQLIIVLFLIAVVIGVLFEYVFKIKWKIKTTHSFEIHKHELKNKGREHSAFYQKLPRIIIGFSLILFALLILFGVIADHEENWFRISMIAVSVGSLIIIISSSAHFVEEHFWKHIIKKHFLVIFIWVFVAFVAIHFLEHQIDVKQWLTENHLYLIFIAALIGLIPTSGPHMIFISLFLSGIIPFSILLVNSIVQEGHGSLPLLGTHRKDFFVMKAIKLVIAFIVGYFLFLMNL